MIFLLLGGLSLAGIGVSGSHREGSAGASVATVDGYEISYQDLSRARNNNQIPGQQALDSLVDRTLVRLFAERAGFAAGAGSIRQTLQDIAPGGVTEQGLNEMLASLRMTPAELEREIQNESVSRQLYSVVSAAVIPSKLEIAQGIAEFSAVKTVSLATLNMAAVLTKTAAPSAEQIAQYYREQTSDFEIAPTVAYDYVLFTPEKYKDSVVIANEDIELYYADHQKKFAIPATVTAKHIRMLYPKDGKPAALNAVKDRAQRVYLRAKAGENFDNLALEFSDDVATKISGGSLGEIARGKMSPEFDVAVFKLKEPGIAELIEADYGFQVVSVVTVHPDAVRPLAAVKEEIRVTLQKIDAPAYASARAAQLFTGWTKNAGSLKQFAQSHGLIVSTSAGKLSAAQDPLNTEAGVSVKGLTAAIFANGEQANQRVELDTTSALVEVTARTETEVASLADATEKIVNTLKLREAKGMIRAKAEELSKTTPVSEFDKKAKELGFTVQATIELKGQDTNPPSALNIGDLPIKLRRMQAVQIAAPVIDGDTTYVAAIKAIVAEKANSTSPVKPEQQQMQRQMVARQLQYELASLVEKSLLSNEKRTAKIDIKPGAYAGE